MSIPTSREYQARMQRDGMVREFEYQVRQRDGGILWLSDSATSVRDEPAWSAMKGRCATSPIKAREDAIAEGRRLLQEVIDPCRGDQREEQGTGYVLMNRTWPGSSESSGGRDRPYHNRPDVALRRAKNR